MALVKVSLAGAVTALGGLVGYFLVGQLHDWLPYFLAVASSSFVYVALADLIPQLQKRSRRARPWRRSPGCWWACARRLQGGDWPATSSRCASVSRPGLPGTRRR
jgi:hypothetical protein